MPSDIHVIEIGNYAKGWYGSFTGSTRLSYDELKVIIRHICALSADCNISDGDCFRIVAEAFQMLSQTYNGGNNRMYNALWADALFPSPWMVLPQEKNDTPDVRLLNKMLLGIARLRITDFPGKVMVMDATIARLFPNGEERIAKRKELGFEIKNV
jgi:hypothetical protein